MFSMDYFLMDPKPFFDFAKEIFPGNFRPSPCHFFIAELEKRSKLLRFLSLISASIPFLTLLNY
jgi:NAD-dependent deacetylase sirtuin 1